MGKNLGPKYLEIPQTDLDLVYNDSDSFTPIIYVLSSGADPT